MQPTILNLEKIIHVYARRLAAVPEAVYAARLQPGKWSKKDILGHLVDSAQNNTRRFIVAQYEDNPTIGYAQDAWVTCSNYQEYPIEDLVTLWILLNRHVVIILRQMSPAAAQRMCSMGGQPQSLEWVAADYVNHLLHHLHQILDLEPIAYP
ncbi:MAG TPA: DinB family protein [Puia sp.]|nr:DinB family protein [Puia sp.]